MRAVDFYGPRRSGLALATACFAWSVLVGEARAQLSFQDLRAIAASAVRNKEVPTRRPAVTTQNGTMSYDPGKVEFQPIFEDGDPDYYPLEALLKIELIKQNYKKFPGDRAGLTAAFWAGPVARAEQMAAEEVNEIARLGRNDKSLPDDLEQKNRAIERVFIDAVKTYAEQNNLQFRYELRAEAVPVTVEVNPPTATLRMMQVLEWYICQKRGFNPQAVMPQVITRQAKVYSGQYIYMLTYVKDGREYPYFPPRRIDMDRPGNATFSADGSVRYDQ